jgi:biotin transport system substrate-specific component
MDEAVGRRARAVAPSSARARAVQVALEAAAVAALALAIALAAELRLPLPGTPVPVTAQTFVVLVGGGLLGARRGALGAAAFGFAGLLGVPWFAGTGGATLGYVAGFVVAAALVGRAAERGLTRRTVSALAVVAAADALVLALGALVLALVLGLDATSAFALGVAPFLVGEVAKVVAAAALLVGLSRGSRRSPASPSSG